MIRCSSLRSCGRCLVSGLLLGVLLWGGALSEATAQQVRTLDIRNGTVYVDGRPVPDDQLPDSINLEGVSAQYQFLGVQRPVIEINDRLFAVENGLRPVTEEEIRDERASVILRDPPRRPSSRGTPSRSKTAHREYLDDVEESSRELYKQLVRERRMEERAQELARVIRLLPDGPERRARIDTLRAMLEEIFDLKQENRRREIERLQRQIQSLEESIQKRNQMRDLMIERRLRDLIHSTQSR